MTTKEQERKALEQIRKIVEGLGEDSYIGTAFEGCFRVAEENIENDWACSMKQRAEAAEEGILKAHEKITGLKKDLEAQKNRAEKAEELFNTAAGKVDNWVGKFHEASDLAAEHWNNLQEEKKRADALEQEIIKLKAKLYDAMVGA